MISPSLQDGTMADGDCRRRQVISAQVRLLYDNANVGMGVTLVATLILGRLEWGMVAHLTIVGWCLYMLLVSAGRCILASRYRCATPSSRESRTWLTGFAIGAGFAGTGWGSAGILLYSEGHFENQVFLVFILGGMMLGAASILAARREAYLAFMLPTGLAPAARLALQGGEAHLAMALMAGVFTIAVLITTNRIHRTIASSLHLQFENADLIEGLQAATLHAQALNEQLEVRVQQRTAELLQSSEQLRAEIVQREQVEEELLRARKLESLGVLAGGIAHDFRNFLAVIQGNIELAQLQMNPDAPVQAILVEAANACHRAESLSSQLLTFSKGGAPVRRLVSLAKLLMDAAPLARAGGQTRIEVSISEGLRYAEVDPGQINQVLHNILLNARQAMSQGGIIEVRAENIDVETAVGNEARVRIQIRDSGCGIPTDVLPLIFDPYFTTKPGGSGLGLATAYAIIAKHGGSLSAKSIPGQGAVFTIELPASRKSPAPEVPTAPLMQKGTERILVMDDEETLLKLSKAILTNLGYEVQTARDGVEAIVLFESAKTNGRSFDVVLLDLTVSGGMGGVEAAARLKNLDSSLKLIVSSGYSDGSVMSDFRSYGFDDALPKPWTVSQVSEVLRRVLVTDTGSNAR